MEVSQPIYFIVCRLQWMKATVMYGIKKKNLISFSRDNSIYIYSSQNNYTMQTRTLCIYKTESKFKQFQKGDKSIFFLVKLKKDILNKNGVSKDILMTQNKQMLEITMKIKYMGDTVCIHTPQVSRAKTATHSSRRHFDFFPVFVRNCCVNTNFCTSQVCCWLIT